ncbi:MAG: hypothetical protein ACK5LC_03355, partial [Coprobacillaceae bacterium]
MAQEKRRFSFDDEEDKVEEEMGNTLPKSEPIPEEVFLDTSSNNESVEIEEPQGDKNMKKKKRKFRLHVWHVVLLVFVLAVGGFTAYIFASTNTDGPVYGDRCAALVEIDEKKFDEVEQQMVTADGIQSIEITKDCRMIDIVINFDENVGWEGAQTLATQTLQTLDAALGQAKSNEESAYSQVFGEANGRGQYNVSFRLRST